MPPRRTRFVLVRPRSAGNVGSAARALKNLGFTHLVMVRPACDPGAPEARKMAVEARDVLAGARISTTLDDALAGAAVVVGTTGRRGRQRRPHWRVDEVTALAGRLDATAETAWVFGPEDHGLTDDELDRCTHLAWFPSSPRYSSLNLAQAVLLVAWELRRSGLEPAPPRGGLPAPAAHESREAMYAHVETALRAIGFLKPEGAVSIMRRLRRMFGRTGLTEDEVVLLRGIARQVLWSAEQAGLTGADSGRDSPREGDPP